MDKGEVLEQGSAEKVADEYLKRAKARGNERLSALNRAPSAYPRWGTGEIETLDVDMLDGAGNATHVFKVAEPFRVRVRYKVHARVENPVFGIGLYRSDGTYVNGANHHWREHPILIDAVVPGEVGEVEMRFDTMPLLAGQYYVTTFLYDHSKAAPTAIDHREHAVTFEVIDAARLQHGMLFLPSIWTLKRTNGGKTDISESRS
jgi:lipopolysaccharide transport system ATP-binding protein